MSTESPRTDRNRTTRGVLVATFALLTIALLVTWLLRAGDGAPPLVDTTAQAIDSPATGSATVAPPADAPGAREAMITTDAEGGWTHPDRGALRVRVVGVRGGTPMAGVRVSLRHLVQGSSRSRTNANGEVVFRDLAPVDSLVVHCEAFAQQLVTILATAWTTCELKLDNDVDANVLVLDPDGSPVAGAKVVAHNAGRTPHATTDATGRCSFRGFVRGVEFATTVNGKRAFCYVGHEPRVEVTLQLPEEDPRPFAGPPGPGNCRARILVVDENRRPVANAEVTVARIRTKSDARGVALFDALHGPKQHVRVEAIGFVTASRAVDLESHREAFAEVRLTRTRGVIIEVVADDRPVEFARVFTPTVRPVSTNRLGRATLHLPAGEHEVSAKHRLTGSGSIKVMVAAKSDRQPLSARLELDAGRVVTGKVVDTAGKPVAGFIIMAKREATDPDWKSVARTRSGSDGSFRLIEIPSNTHFSVLAQRSPSWDRSQNDGPVRSVIGTILGRAAVAPDQDHIEIVVHPTKGALLGRVVYDREYWGTGPNLRLHERTTDTGGLLHLTKDGRFHGTELPPGEYEVIGYFSGARQTNRTNMLSFGPFELGANQTLDVGTLDAATPCEYDFVLDYRDTPVTTPLDIRLVESQRVVYRGSVQGRSITFDRPVFAGHYTLEIRGKGVTRIQRRVHLQSTRPNRVVVPLEFGVTCVLRLRHNLKDPGPVHLEIRDAKGNVVWTERSSIENGHELRLELPPGPNYELRAQTRFGSSSHPFSIHGTTSGIEFTLRPR